MFCTACQSTPCDDPTAELHRRWTVPADRLAWCIACEQYEIAGRGCDDIGMQRPSLDGESMFVIYDRLHSDRWALARRGYSLTQPIFASA